MGAWRRLHVERGVHACQPPRHTAVPNPGMPSHGRRTPASLQKSIGLARPPALSAAASTGLPRSHVRSCRLYMRMGMRTGGGTELGTSRWAEILFACSLPRWRLLLHRRKWARSSWWFAWPVGTWQGKGGTKTNERCQNITMAPSRLRSTPSQWSEVLQDVNNKGRSWPRGCVRVSPTLQSTLTRRGSDGLVSRVGTEHIAFAKPGKPAWTVGQGRQKSHRLCREGPTGRAVSRRARLR